MDVTARALAPIRAFLFDKDGTLYHFTRSWSGWCHDFVTAEAGDDTSLRSRMAAALGFDMQARSFYPASVVISGTLAEVAETLVPLLPGTGSADIAARIAGTSALAPQVEAAPLAPLLDSLRARGHRLGVATNDAVSVARAHLTASSVLDRFDFVAGYDSGHGAKPAPGMLLAFANAVRLRPEEIAMVGDSRHDMVAARAAGMLAVGVLTGPARADDLEPFADIVLDSVADLVPLAADWTKNPGGRS
jgi:phosphoglycolate phosphatase